MYLLLSNSQAKLGRNSSQPRTFLTCHLSIFPCVYQALGVVVLQRGRFGVVDLGDGAARLSGQLEEVALDGDAFCVADPEGGGEDDADEVGGEHDARRAADGYVQTEINSNR